MEIHNLTARIIPERAYSVSEAARYLGVHRCTIYACLLYTSNTDGMAAQTIVTTGVALCGQDKPTQDMALYNGRGAGRHAALDLNAVMAQRKAGKKTVLLLEVPSICDRTSFTVKFCAFTEIIVRWA